MHMGPFCLSLIDSFRWNIVQIVSQLGAFALIFHLALTLLLVLSLMPKHVKVHEAFRSVW